MKNQELKLEQKEVAEIIRRMRRGKGVRLKLQELNALIRFCVDHFAEVDRRLMSDLQDREYLRKLIKHTEYYIGNMLKK